MRGAIKVSVVQMDSRDDVAENFRQCLGWIAEAGKRGDEIIAFPEHCLYLGKDRSFSFGERGPEIPAVCSAARRAGVNVLLGSYRERIGNSRKIRNTALWIGANGRITARYRKIHLFESHFDHGPNVTEAETVVPGRKAVTVRRGGFTAGLSICYDLRFPELYRRLAFRGAEVLFVPSNFNRHTGRAHWFPLLRARAIENQAYVVAPAQVGTKPDGWVAFGHACVINPWGEVLFDAGERMGAFSVPINMDCLRQLRTEMPALSGARLRTIRKR